jgi:hypothetical protein
MLDHDVLQAISGMALDTALAMALVCTDWREAIEHGNGNVFDTRRALLNLGDTALLTELKTTLALTSTKLQVHPHKLKRRFGGGKYKIFTRATYISIFHAHGGAPQLEERLMRRVKRQLAQKWRVVA